MHSAVERFSNAHLVAYSDSADFNIDCAAVAVTFGATAQTWLPDGPEAAGPSFNGLYLPAPRQ